MLKKNNFTLFIENLEEYEYLTKREKKEFYPFFLTIKKIKTDQERMNFVLNIANYLNVNNLTIAMSDTSTLKKKLYTEMLEIYKNYISLIINIEYKIKEYDYTYLGKNMKKEYRKYLFSKHKNLAVNKKSIDKKAGRYFFWKKNEKHEKIICPYCNIQYLNYNNGYSEIDHIFPQVYYPALINVEVNHLESCKKCNNAKRDNVIDFSIDEIYELHSNKFLVNSFVFNNELFNQIDNNNFLENMLKLSNKKTSNSKSDIVSTRNKLNEINMYMMISNFSIDNNLHKLKILERYQSLHKILYRMYQKFTFDISKLGPEMECAYQIYSNDMDGIYDFMFQTQVLQNLFDDFTDEDREQLEVIYYWRKEFVKSMIYQYIQDIKERNVN